MKLKSLLLGSAAALVAVSGARAADAIVVEAEPMEYVRVCDMYGKGYFYIPGTETCLKLSGQLRVRYRVNGDHDDGVVSDHEVNTRVRLYFDAKNETEYGTLTSKVRLAFERNEFTYQEDYVGKTSYPTSEHDIYSTREDGDQALAEVDIATISLAGFTVGHGTDRTNIGQWRHINSANDQANFLDYTYSSGAVAITVGIQEFQGSGAVGQPDPYAVLSYKGDGFGLKAMAVRDSSVDNFAYGVSANMDLSSFIPGGKLRGFWLADGDDHFADVNILTDQTDYVKGHLWGVRMDYKLADKLTGYTRYQAYDSGQIGSNDSRGWRSGVNWKIASGVDLNAQYEKFIHSGKHRVEIELTRKW